MANQRRNTPLKPIRQWYIYDLLGYIFMETI